MGKQVIEKFRDALVKVGLGDRASEVNDYLEYGSLGESACSNLNDLIEYKIGNDECESGYNLTIEEVDKNGGEGEGEYYNQVFKVTVTTPESIEVFYIESEGHYDSWEGVSYYCGWDTFHEVKPVEVKVTQYVAV